VGARDDDLRAAVGVVHLGDVDADALAGIVPLGRHLLAARHDRLGAAQLDDRGARLDALDHAVDDLVLALGELVQDHLALAVAQLLQDDLLGRLRGDPPERRRRDVDRQSLTHHGLDAGSLLGGDPDRVLVEELVVLRDAVRVIVDEVVDHQRVVVDLHVAGARLDLGRQVVGRRVEVALVGRDQGGLDGVDHHLPRHALFVAELRDRGEELGLHGYLTPPNRSLASSRMAVVMIAL
jgi:hypothetical protein